MKTIVLFLILSFNAFASPPTGSAKTEQLKVFAKKMCVLSVARATSTDGDRVITPIYCVMNGSIGEGTIFEESGCLLSLIDPISGGSYPAFERGSSFSVSKTKHVDCNKAIVKSILESKEPILPAVKLLQLSHPFLNL